MQKIIGIDEVGRGALAGPVVACAVLFKKEKIFSGIKDSKKTSPLKREAIFEEVQRSNLVEWGVGIVSEKVIDRINILEATKLAMIKSLEKMGHKDAYLIIDGNFSIDAPYEQESLPKADEKVLQCSLASIIAKVIRDNMMRSFDSQFPQYGFYHHKGYGTSKHRDAIRRYGPCAIHRTSFRLL